MSAAKPACVCHVDSVAPQVGSDSTGSLPGLVLPCREGTLRDKARDRTVWVEDGGRVLPLGGQKFIVAVLSPT